MAFTQGQLAAIEEAIASGATRVSYDGKSVEYADLSTMLRIRDIIMRALGMTPNASATILAAHYRGFPGGSTFEDSELYTGQ